MTRYKKIHVFSAQKRGKPWLPEHIAPAKFIAELDHNIQYFFEEVNSFMRILFKIIAQRPSRSQFVTLDNSGDI